MRPPNKNKAVFPLSYKKTLIFFSIYLPDVGVTEVNPFRAGAICAAAACAAAACAAEADSCPAVAAVMGEM